VGLVEVSQQPQASGIWRGRVGLAGLWGGGGQWGLGVDFEFKYGNLLESGFCFLFGRVGGE